MKPKIILLFVCVLLLFTRSMYCQNDTSKIKEQTNQIKSDINVKVQNDFKVDSLALYKGQAGKKVKIKNATIKENNQNTSQLYDSTLLFKYDSLVEVVYELQQENNNLNSIIRSREDTISELHKTVNMLASDEIRDKYYSIQKDLSRLENDVLKFCLFYPLEIKFSDKLISFLLDMDRSYCKWMDNPNKKIIQDNVKKEYEYLLQIYGIYNKEIVNFATFCEEQLNQLSNASYIDEFKRKIKYKIKELEYYKNYKADDKEFWPKGIITWKNPHITFLTNEYNGILEVVHKMNASNYDKGKVELAILLSRIK